MGQKTLQNSERNRLPDQASKDAEVVQESFRGASCCLAVLFLFFFFFDKRKLLLGPQSPHPISSYLHSCICLRAAVRPRGSLRPGRLCLQRSNALGPTGYLLQVVRSSVFFWIRTTRAERSGGNGVWVLGSGLEGD
jgi:hypothetical protein